MKRMAFPWRKAASGILLGAILFLTILPYFGWAWHRVLPEHTHVFFGAPHEDAADDGTHSALAPATPSPENEPDLCANCTGTQISSGLLHLPGSMVAQILGIAVSVAALFLIRIPPELSGRVIRFRFFYGAPVFAPPDPPPM